MYKTVELRLITEAEIAHINLSTDEIIDILLSAGYAVQYTENFEGIFCNITKTNFELIFNI
jgi:hypothetical protein